MKGSAPPNTQKNPIDVPGLMPDLLRLHQKKPWEVGNNTNRSASLMVYCPAGQRIAPFQHVASTHREPNEVRKSLSPVSVGSLSAISEKNVTQMVPTHRHHSVQLQPGLFEDLMRVGFLKSRRNQWPEFRP